MVNSCGQQRGKRHAVQTHTSKLSAAVAISPRSMKHLLLLFAFCLAASLLAGVAFAQSVNGLISGTVLARISHGLGVLS